MTHVKFQTPRNTSLQKMMDEFFTGIPLNEGGQKAANHFVPVNIFETELEYRLDVIVPGFQKSELHVRLEDNILTIEGMRDKRQNETPGRKIKQEYSVSDFKRSFTIDEKIDATRIQASFVNGVLSLNFPNKKEVKESKKEITIN